MLGEAGKQSVPADCFKKGYKPSKGVDFALKEFEVDGSTARLGLGRRPENTRDERSPGRALPGRLRSFVSL